MSTLKELHCRAGHTHQTVADILGRDRSTVTHILNEGCDTMLSVAVRLADLYGISLDALYRAFLETRNQREK